MKQLLWVAACAGLAAAGLAGCDNEPAAPATTVAAADSHPDRLPVTTSHDPSLPDTQAALQASFQPSTPAAAASAASAPA